ncbi:MAG: bifunctional metallophosphatase/5'-nucleotidase [Anaerolineales bacterium]
MRKISLIIIVLSLVWAMAAFAQNDEAETFQLTIMHTNDTHANHEADGDGNGGIARQATVVSQIRGEVENSVLLDAGDRFTGTLYHTQYRGADQIEIMNALGYDALVLGNHEYDDGESALEAFVQGVAFPVLSANVDYSAFPGIDEAVEPFTVLDVNGEQVGVIGITTPDSVVTSSPSDEIMFNDDLTAVAQQHIDELAEQGVNRIIVLTHIGLSFDTELATSLSGADIIIGGHSHTLLSNTYADAAGEYPMVMEGADGNPVLVVQAGSNNAYLGRLDVEFDADGVLADWDGDTILLSRYIQPDAELASLLEDLAGPVNELREQPIGAEAAVLLDGARTVCRIEECALGNIISDAILAETGADIAIQNGGGIRADIDAGDITVGEILTVLPFGNTIATADLTGELVVAALENGVSRVEVGDDGVISRDGLNGRFPQVGGLRYTFDPTQEVGSRVSNVEVLNQETGEYEPIDPAATYFVGTNNFMLDGGDGYEQFAEGSTLYAFGRPLDQAVIDYMAELGTVEPNIEGRITLEGAELAER